MAEFQITESGKLHDLVIWTHVGNMERDNEIISCFRSMPITGNVMKIEYRGVMHEMSIAEFLIRALNIEPKDIS